LTFADFVLWSTKGSVFFQPSCAELLLVQRAHTHTHTNTTTQTKTQREAGRKGRTRKKARDASKAWKKTRSVLQLLQRPEEEQDAEEVALEQVKL
jgi:hypothetical protein